VVESDIDQLLRILDGERAEANRVNQLEHRGIRANSQSQSENSDGSEAGSFSQSANRESQI
jgi:hypothetical protein